MVLLRGLFETTESSPNPSPGDESALTRVPKNPSRVSCGRAMIASLGVSASAATRRPACAEAETTTRRERRRKGGSTGGM